jgi:cysteine desulfurase
MIYLDNHSTTRVDPRVVATMSSMMEVGYANAGSTTHLAGREVALKVSQSIRTIASCLNLDPDMASDELVMTSGATEANNLAIFGVCLHPRQKRRQIISVVTEHRAVLDPLERLKQHGFEVVLLPVWPQGHKLVGQIDLEQASQLITDKTALVSVMHSNNEIGCFQPIQELAALCHYVGAILHTDATQTVGHEALNVSELGCDLMSFSAHKFYGPKGSGGLYIASRHSGIRLQAQILGGGQQFNRRSGTIDSVGVVGMAEALRLAVEELPGATDRDCQLRDRLWGNLQSIEGESIRLNGPALNDENRLARNLNIEVEGIEGQTLMLLCEELCMSSGSACTSAEPLPSHVLQSIGLTADQARCSIRFGVGRFTTEHEIDRATEVLAESLRSVAR